MSKQWFIMNVFTGKEKQIKHKLEELAAKEPEKYGTVLIPETTETVKNDNGSSTTTKRLNFPGYVFAELDAFRNFSEHEKNDDVWKAVSGLEEMIGFLGGDNPRPMSEDEVESVRKLMNSKASKKVVLKEGDSVKVLDGAFANNVGTIKKIEDDVATVSVEIFGEETEQEIPIGSLEKEEEE